MLLPRTQKALEESEEHIDGTNTRGTTIEAFLTQYILILLSSEMESELHAVIEAKAEQLNQKDLREFIMNAGKSCIRGVKKEAIAQFLSCFGGTYQQDFNDSLILKEKEITIYGNAIIYRHSIAHRGGAQVTFNEIKAAVESAKIILSAVRSVLRIDHNDASEEKEVSTK